MKTNCSFLSISILSSASQRHNKDSVVKPHPQLTCDKFFCQLHTFRMAEIFPVDWFKYILQLCKRCSFTNFGKGMDFHNSDLGRAAFSAHLVWSSINLAIIWILPYPTKVVYSNSIWITDKSAISQEGRQVQAEVRMRSCLGCKGRCFTGFTVQHQRLHCS